MPKKSNSEISKEMIRQFNSTKQQSDIVMQNVSIDLENAVQSMLKTLYDSAVTMTEAADGNDQNFIEALYRLQATITSSISSRIIDIVDKFYIETFKDFSPELSNFFKKYKEDKE